MPNSKLVALPRLPPKALDPEDLPEGMTLCDGRFQITHRLGRGGVATVYAARDVTRGAMVALKILSETRSDDERERARFKNEVRINETIRTHPNLVHPFELGTIPELGDRPYLTTELVNGPTLCDLLLGAALPPQLALRFIRDAARGVAHLHDSGVIHRDVKPSNVVVDRDTPQERARLLDFGYAIARKNIALPAGSRLTLVDERPGTKHYMAPEQLMGLPASTASDVYALSVSLFELLTGAPPFNDLSPADAARRKVDPEHPEPRIQDSIDVAEPLAGLLRDGLRRDPAHRIPDAHTFIHRVESLLEAETEPPEVPARRRSRWRLWGGVAVLAAVTAVGAAIGHGLRPDAAASLQSFLVVDPAELLPPRPEPTPAPPPPSPLPEPAADATQPQAPEPPPKRRPRTTPPPRRSASAAIDCGQARDAAKTALQAKNWNAYARHTTHARCWPSRKMWLRERVVALYWSKSYSRCVRVASRSKDPEVARYRNMCATMHERGQ